MYNINLPGLPDFSKIDFSNIDLSQFGVPTPAAVAPVQPPVLPAATAPAPAPAPVPAFDPYAGMTQADLAEIGVFIPPPAMVAPPVQTPVPAPVPQPTATAPVPVPTPTPTPTPTPVPQPAFDPYAGMTEADLAEIGMAAPMPQMVAPPVQTPAPAPEPVQPAPLMGIEGLAPNFAMTEDFALPVTQREGIVRYDGPVPEFVGPTPENRETVTTMAVGEEDGGGMISPGIGEFTTMAVGEEDNGKLVPPKARETVENRGRATTMAVGEEDGGFPPERDMITTMAMGEEDGGYFADLDPNSPAMNAETLGGTPDVSNVAQSLINTGPITLPNGETFDIRDLDLSGVDLSRFSPPQEAINEAQGTTPAQTTRAGEDLAQIPGGYFAPASDYYTDGQLADMGIEPGTTVSTGANPQQPAGTPLNISPEQQAAIDNWLANNPPGTVINLPGGGSVTVPGYTGGTGSTGSTRTVNPNDLMLQNLQIQQGQGGRGGSVATQFGLRGVAPTQPVERGNPFRRPGDEGIASLVPSGG